MTTVRTKWPLSGRVVTAFGFQTGRNVVEYARNRSGSSPWKELMIRCTFWTSYVLEKL